MGENFKLGDEVSISFIGKITEMYISIDNKVFYVVDSGSTFARRVVESQLCFLPQEEAVSEK